MQINSWKKWVILKKILILKIKKELSIGELAELIPIKQNHPYFQCVFKYTVDNGVITYTKKIGTTQFIKINHKKLLNLIWDTEYIDDVMDVITIKYPLGFMT